MIEQLKEAGMTALSRGVDLLLSADLGALSATGLTALLIEVETIRRRLDAVDHLLIAEAGQRSLAGEYARSSTADLLVDLLRTSPAAAKARVSQAGDLAARRALSGELLPPLMPAAAASLAEGAISTEHVRVISDCLDALPSTVDVAAVGVVETMLVTAAHHEHPGSLRRTAAMLLARLDPDGIEPRADELNRRRDLTLSRNRDGSGHLTGRLTPEATAQWATILGTLSAPAPAQNGAPDDRSAGQRRHDGLVEAGQRLLRSGDLPAVGGVPVTILARTTLAELRSLTGLAQTAYGDLVPVRDLAAMSSDAEIVPVVCDERGRVLRLGRTRRLASRAQRLALAARDGGCTFPGCDRPASWTEVHHIIPWQDGGASDLDNLCLLCRFHHREFERRGWQVRTADGIPEWIPPPWLDPAQQPRHNTAHHPPELVFDLGRVPAA